MISDLAFPVILLESGCEAKSDVRYMEVSLRGDGRLKAAMSWFKGSVLQ
jgi:hypothetical protein